MKSLSEIAESIRSKANWSIFAAAVKAFAAHPSLGNAVAVMRSGALLIGAVVALGVLTIVIPIVYLVSVQVGNTLPAGGLTNGQSSTLATLINNGGSALQLTTVSETDATKHPQKSWALGSYSWASTGLSGQPTGPENCSSNSVEDKPKGTSFVVRSIPIGASPL